MPESKRHLLVRTALFQIIQRFTAGNVAVGSDQFVYWNAADPSQCLAPDVFVRTGQRDLVFDSWKTWERGAPHLAVEIVSDSDASELQWDHKLQRYLAIGIQELVRFDPQAPAGGRLRVWERLEGDLLERVVTDDLTSCDTLGLWWCVREAPEVGPMLRLSSDATADTLLLTPQEAIAQLEAELAALRK